jgi:hypothetical protein
MKKKGPKKLEGFPDKYTSDVLNEPQFHQSNHLDMLGASSYTDPEQRIEIRIDSNGFHVRIIERPDPNDVFEDGYFPGELIRSIEERRLSDIEKALNKWKDGPASDDFEEMVDEFSLGELMELESSMSKSKFLRLAPIVARAVTENADLDEDDDETEEWVNLVSDAWNQEMQKGPITCSAAPEPDFCGMELTWDEKNYGWRLNVMGMTEDDFPTAEIFTCRTFAEVVSRLEEEGIELESDGLKKLMIKDDRRWANVLRG